MKLVAVNGRKWSSAVLKDAIKSAHENHQPIEVIAEIADMFKTYSITYDEGLQSPHLERVEGQPDVLGEIIKAKTGGTTKP
jgi:hypothetical protein